MLRFLLLIYVLCFTFFKVYAQATDAPILVKQGVDFVTARNEEAALDKFKEALKSDPNNYEAAWHASLLCSRIGNRQTDEQKKKEYFVLAKQYAVKSLKLNQTDFESNYVMAVAMGRMALISGTKDKVAASHDIKNYVDLAIKYNPNYAGSWYVLGKWNYEMASLNFAELAIAKVLYGGVPSGATVAEAINCYNKAIALDSSVVMYYYDLAIAYNSSKQKDKAVVALNKGILLPVKIEDDPIYIQKCKDLLNTIKQEK